MLQPRAHLWRARLAVPDLERIEIDAASIFQGRDEIVAGRCFAIIPVEIKVCARAELVRTEHRMEHADDLGALVVDGRRVEVRNLDIAVRSDRMRKRALVLWKLNSTEDAHILNPLDRCASHISGKALVPEDGEALLQAELEP